MAYETHQFSWRGITIEARYDPDWLEHGSTAHLEIRALNPRRAPLPITETGYLSHFHTRGIIEDSYGGDVIAAVTEWLDEAAKSTSWKAKEAAARQGDLFAWLSNIYSAVLYIRIIY